MKKPLPQFVLLCVTLFALCATAGAADVVDSGTCGDNLTWTLDSDGVLTISGAGAMDDWLMFDRSPWYEKRQDIVTAIIRNGVASVGWGAFKNCANLTNVTIPNSVASIGDSAFNGCASLTSVTIPSGVTNIVGRAFDGCASLTSILVDSGNQSYMSENGVLFDKKQTKLLCYPMGKAGAYEIPDSVTSIGNDAFLNCASLTGVTIPDSVASIGGRAFSYCASLTSVTIPDSVASIGSGAFSHCAELTNVTIPVSVTFIGNMAFFPCASLTDIYYGGSAAQWKEAYLWTDYAPDEATIRTTPLLSKATIHYGAEDIGVGITLTDESGEIVDANGQTGDTEETKKDAFQDGAEFQAKFDAVDPAASSGFVAASVFIVFYDRDGLMVDLISKEIDLSDPWNLMFVLNIRIPEGAKTLKFLMLGDNLEPLRAVRLIESSADDGA